jgi:CubicO group peptidase (beta-lactamase class C family)
VRDAFAAGLARGGGAAFAAWRGGECLVDIWGGTADEAAAAPWREETLQVIFSGTKGLVAACVLALVDRGELELEAEVGRYWPEFAQAGKSRLTVADLLAHRAGLAALTSPLEPGEALEPDRPAALLARQEPFWPDGEPFAYHALTFGWLCHGLVRAVAGTTIGALFGELFARPLGLEVWVGLPDEMEPRVSTLTVDDWSLAEPVRHPEYARKIFSNPEVFGAGFPLNQASWHQAEIPAVNGIARARDLAKLYACFASGGQLDGRRLISEATLEIARRPLSRGPDPFFDAPFAFGCGFELQAAEFRRFGPLADAFGHTGAGGSIHGASPTYGVGFSYCTNRMCDEQNDDRGRSLLRALEHCLRERAS